MIIEIDGSRVERDKDINTDQDSQDHGSRRQRYKGSRGFIYFYITKPKGKRKFPS